MGFFPLKMNQKLQHEERFRKTIKGKNFFETSFLNYFSLKHSFISFGKFFKISLSFLFMIYLNLHKCNSQRALGKRQTNIYKKSEYFTDQEKQTNKEKRQKSHNLRDRKMKIDKSTISQLCRFEKLLLMLITIVVDD